MSVAHVYVHVQHPTPERWCSCCTVQLVTFRQAGALPARIKSPRDRAIILQECSDAGITAEELLSDDRHGHVCAVRNEIAVRLRRCGYSYPHIGRILGRDHSSIIAMIKRKEEVQT